MNPQNLIFCLFSDSTLESTKSSIDIEFNTNTQRNSDLTPITTQQNINDLTEVGITINPLDISEQLITETNIESNDLIDKKSIAKTSNSSEINISTNYENLIDSELSSRLKVMDTKESETNDETLNIRTESTINGQQIRSDDLVIKNEEQISLPNQENNRTDISVDSLIETTTDKYINQTAIDYFKSDIKQDFYSENQTIITNDIEITTQSIAWITTNSVFNSSDYSNLSLTSETSFISNEFLENVSNNESLNVSMKTNFPNKDNETKLLQNETSYDSVGVIPILQGIIHAIDKQIQRRIPAEPRLKNNSSDETSESKQLNYETKKPLTYRSENKAGPSLSSSFFITDDNEPPYKSDSDGVEIITAKTAFYDLHENPGDSILINLTPSSLKVSSSPFNPNKNPSNDKKFDIMAQNNRAAIYGRPINPFPQPYPQSNNDWRVVNSDFPRRPQFEGPPSPLKPIESLYYTNNRRQDSDEAFDQVNSDIDKRPRLEFENPMDSNRMKVIPFKVNDAVAGLSHKRKNGSFLIRVSSPNKNSLAPDLTSKPNQQSSIFSIKKDFINLFSSIVSCFFNNLEYPNGAMIPKSDPCTLCRCFYGRELCQQQKCPAPPEKDCVPEKMNGYCCPRYICSNLKLKLSCSFILFFLIFQELLKTRRFYQTLNQWMV